MLFESLHPEGLHVMEDEGEGQRFYRGQTEGSESGDKWDQRKAMLSAAEGFYGSEH